MVRLLVCVVFAAALGLGCQRSFTHVTPQAVGAHCQSGLECGNGLCQDGFCCDRSCTGAERCDAPGHEGTCQARQLGDACTAATECPGGHCVDGVCCESACDGLCQTCKSALTPGICSLVDDGKDPRNDCKDTCLACFGGSCGAALIDTDPHGGCGLAQNSGKACGYAQSCAKIGGSRCTQDADCTSLHCLSGFCLDYDVEVVTNGVNPAAQQRRIQGVGASPEGDEALVYAEVQSHDEGSTTTIDADDLKIAFHHAGRAWQGALLARGTPLNLNEQGSRAEVLFRGRSPFVVLWKTPPYENYQPACDGGGCDLHAFTLADNGTFANVETVAPRVTQIDGLHALAESNGQVSVIFKDATGFHLVKRSATPPFQWVETSAEPAPDGYVYNTLSLLQLQGGRYFGYATAYDGGPGDGIHFDAVDHGKRYFVPVSGGSFNCDATYFIQLKPARGHSLDDSAALAINCANRDTKYAQALYGTFAPAADGGLYPDFNLISGGTNSLAVPVVGDSTWLAQRRYDPLDFESNQMGVTYAENGHYVFSPAYSAPDPANFTSFDATAGQGGLPFIGFTRDQDSSAGPIPGGPSLVIIRYRP